MDCFWTGFFDGVIMTTNLCLLIKVVFDLRNSDRADKSDKNDIPR